MRRIVRVAAQLGGVATVVFLIALAGAPVSTTLLVQAYLLVLGAIVLLAFVLTTTRLPDSVGASDFERALRRPQEEPRRPPELARLEREVVLACGSAFYLHFRLRRTLREIARHRLRDRRGLDLDRGGPGVEDALGAVGWELLRPDRPEPLDPGGRGLPLAELHGLVERLEKI